MLGWEKRIQKISSRMAEDAAYHTAAFCFGFRLSLDFISFNVHMVDEDWSIFRFILFEHQPNIWVDFSERLFG